MEKPVAFYSRQLKDAETCYAATELECLAVVESVRHFEVYFLVQTPQNPGVTPYFEDSKPHADQMVSLPPGITAQNHLSSRKIDR